MTTFAKAMNAVNDAEQRYRAALETLARKLVDDGLLIEAGWIGLRRACLPPDTGELQLREMRMAFFAGAQHLFVSIMAILEPDAEPTDNDLRRMDLIEKELERFIQKFGETIQVKGRA
jgi:hypothetical protein